MNCRTCKFWHSDEQDPQKSMRGYCSETRADKAGSRTVFDYGCRHWSSRPTQLAPDAGASAASSELVQASALSTSQAESAPTQRG